MGKNESLNIPIEKLKAFQAKHENGDVWQVHTGENWITIFLFYDYQIEKHKSLTIYEEIKEEYADLASKYLGSRKSPSEIAIYFDSKENFETKYKSNWGFYYT